MKSKRIIVMPACHAAATLEMMLRGIREGFADGMILVKDSNSQSLMQAVHFGFEIGDLPVPPRYMREAPSINFSRVVAYGLGEIKTLLQYLVQRLRLMKWNLFES